MGKRLGQRILAVVSASFVIVGAVAATATAAPPDTKGFSAKALAPTSTITAAKSVTGQIAKSDPALLARTDSASISIMVKLDYDSAAAYSGGVKGYAATSPQITGKSLNTADPAVSNYLKHTNSQSATAANKIRTLVPGATVTGTYNVAYGGLSVKLPANQAKKLLSIPGVAAVQQDKVQQPDSVSPSPSDQYGSAAISNDTTKFIGADKVWPSLGGQKLAGKGVILGVLDTGIWPEHPMLVDGGYLPKPGPASKTWGCQFGDGSVAKLGAAFSCNNKLIGAYAFTDTNLQVNGAQPGEFCDTTLTSTTHPYGTCSARDADGHGTHTSTTAAGDEVDHAVLLGVDRGPISGIAPGASVIMYRVCLTNGCYSSDSVRAVQQAIIDGVNVINFSIGGGANAYTDPVELAFLDAYAAGISVNASAGNSGPDAATAEHAGPWVTTVGASTSDRAFESTVTLSSTDGNKISRTGATITAGVTDKPVVLAASVPGYTGTAFCLTPFAAGSLTGEVVVCERGGGGGGRVEKGYFASQGGAAGMILYNPTHQADIETDNHFLPAIHLDGPQDDMLAFITGHPNVTATWAVGAKAVAQGDVMAGFSSRGPDGSFIKPDITAPGVQVLAGNTPASIDLATGPTGQLYQAIAGTSMASPHAAGAALLIKAAHPGWTPGQIKSAEMTSSLQDVIDSDGVTPANPWARGAGSLRVNRAVSPTLTFNVSANAYAASSTDALDRVDLNVPSINADPLAGVVATTRVAQNVSGRTQTMKVSVQAPAGLKITVTPSTFTLGATAKQTLKITIDGTDLADDSQTFGQITLKAVGTSATAVVLPVAAHRTEGDVDLKNSCAPASVMPKEVTTCTVTAQNLSSESAPAKVTTTVPSPLVQNFVSPPAHATSTGASWSGTLTPRVAPNVDSVNPGASPGEGYLPLSAFGIAPATGVGDETVTNFNTAAFKFGNETYTSVGVDSNGYVIIGGGTSEDNECCNLTPFPNAARPNNVIAPFWTDLNPSTGGEVRVGSLTDGVNSFVVIDYSEVVAFGTTTANTFEVWIQVGATEGQWISYGTLGGPNAQPLEAGVENRTGSSGVNITPASDSEFVVKMAPATPGGSVSFRYQVSSPKVGTYGVVASLTTPVVKGTTTKKATITVAK